MHCRLWPDGQWEVSPISMFKAYQSGPFVDVLTAKDKPPRCRFSDRSNHQIYEKAVKGYVLALDSTSATLSVPADPRAALQLTQPFLVLQLWVTPTQSFSVELTLTDSAHVKRRYLLSSASRDTVVSELHVRTPNRAIHRGEWLNLSIDLHSYVTGCFPPNTFRSLDTITITGVCKLRRVFTMRSAVWCEETPAETWEVVPKTVDFPSGVTSRNQLLRLEKNSETPQSNQISVMEPAPVNAAPVKKPKTAFGSRFGEVVGNRSKDRQSAQPSARREKPSLSPPAPVPRGKVPEADYNPWASDEKPPVRAQEKESVELFRDSPLLKVSIENPLDAVNTVHQGGRNSAIGINPLEDGDIELPPPAYPTYDPASYADSSSSEEVELVYDPVLQCYYDPCTHDYYQVQS